MDENEVLNQVRQMGLSSAQAKKAMKLLKNKNFAKHVENMLPQQNSTANLSAREKLRYKLRKAKESRQVKTTEQKKKEEPEKKKQPPVSKSNKKKYQQRKMKKLQERYGTITDEFYGECLMRIQAGDYESSDDRNRDSNIVALYSKQQRFTKEINMDDDLADFL